MRPVIWHDHLTIYRRTNYIISMPHRHILIMYTRAQKSTKSSSSNYSRRRTRSFSTVYNHWQLLLKQQGCINFSSPKTRSYSIFSRTISANHSVSIPRSSGRLSYLLFGVKYWKSLAGRWYLFWTYVTTSYIVWWHQPEDIICYKYLLLWDDVYELRFMLVLLP